MWWACNCVLPFFWLHSLNVSIYKKVEVTEVSLSSLRTTFTSDTQWDPLQRSVSVQKAVLIGWTTAEVVFSVWVKTHSRNYTVVTYASTYTHENPELNAKSSFCKSNKEFSILQLFQKYTAKKKTLSEPLLVHLWRLFLYFIFFSPTRHLTFFFVSTFSFIGFHTKILKPSTLNRAISILLWMRLRHESLEFL